MPIEKTKSGSGWASVKMKVHAESLRGAERGEAYRRVAAVAPRYGEYPKKTDRVIPVIRLKAISGS